MAGIIYGISGSFKQRECILFTSGSSCAAAQQLPADPPEILS